MELTREMIGQMSAGDLADNVVSIFDFQDPVKRAATKMLMMDRAKQLGVARDLQGVLKEAQEAYDRLAREYTAAHSQENKTVQLTYGSNNRPANTAENFLAIFRGDERFATFRFNLLTVSAELTEDMKIRQWSDRDNSNAMIYMETSYSLFDEQKYRHAMRSFEGERSYHPVREKIDSLKWDGVPRIETFLTRWMKCEDNEYSREVSRLIFAGGIHRIFDPGCKFDVVPVLVGSKQGEGKSTLVRWLAMSNDWYGECTQIEGDKGVEALSGVFVCELGEMLALVRAKEVEAIKAYLSRQVDRYRTPYDRLVTARPRQCIFIGTTNKEQFLTDKTGNRRFFPIRVHSNGYDLYDNEKQIHEDIEQCWAEARAKYDEPFTDLSPRRHLLETISTQQVSAVEDDWRDGMIDAYLQSKVPGYRVCTMELWQEALGYGSFSRPDPKDSAELNIVMQRFGDWVRSDKPTHLPKYGTQRYWTRTGDELPF